VFATLIWVELNVIAACHAYRSLTLDTTRAMVKLPIGFGSACGSTYMKDGTIMAKTYPDTEKAVNNAMSISPVRILLSSKTLDKPFIRCPPLFPNPDAPFDLYMPSSFVRIPSAHNPLSLMFKVFRESFVIFTSSVNVLGRLSVAFLINAKSTSLRLSRLIVVPQFGHVI
jgi:hypothetical protein